MFPLFMLEEMCYFNIELMLKYIVESKIYVSSLHARGNVLF